MIEITDNNVYEDVIEDDIDSKPSSEENSLDNVMYGYTLNNSSINGAEIDCGSGNDRFKFEKDIGIWLGNTDFDSAPFSVDMKGELYAEKGTFGGSLDAASGTFSGSLSAGVEIEAPVISGGEITGSLIQTSNSGGRVVMDDSENSIELHDSDGLRIRLESNPPSFLEYGSIIFSTPSGGDIGIHSGAADTLDIKGDDNAIIARFDSGSDEVDLYFNDLVGVSDCVVGTLYLTNMYNPDNAPIEVNNKFTMNQNNIEDVASLSANDVVISGDLYINTTDQVQVDAEGYLYI